MLAAQGYPLLDLLFAALLLHLLLHGERIGVVGIEFDRILDLAQGQRIFRRLEEPAGAFQQLLDTALAQRLIEPGAQQDDVPIELALPFQFPEHFRRKLVIALLEALGGPLQSGLDFGVVEISERLIAHRLFQRFAKFLGARKTDLGLFSQALIHHLTDRIADVVIELGCRRRAKLLNGSDDFEIARALEWLAQRQRFISNHSQGEKIG